MTDNETVELPVKLSVRSVRSSDFFDCRLYRAVLLA